ncbi:site-specific integrase [Sphingobacterium sp. UME9]|uniref:site-specific integrase n=1 Tax=Sphingobacterium TaxID=28453 RepID=UPI00160386FA|nr:site-specific integrase [Sphingobacterium sp. UME9]MBB1642792.1 integrase [Sphingobacterium sp. UME9]
MNNQKVHILFWLKRSKKTSDGTCPLYARITIEGEEEPLSLGIKIKPQFWDTNIKRDTESSATARENNLKISKADVDLDTHLKILRSKHEKITPLMLKNAYLGLPLDYIGPVQKSMEIEKKPTLLKVFDDFIKRFEKLVKKKDRSNDTLKHWRSAKKKVISFIKFQYEAKDFELENITYSFAEKFFDYMTLEVDKPISAVTAKGYIKKLKQILEGCAKNKLIPLNPIKAFVCYGGDKEIEPLEFYQVNSIYRKDLPINRLSEVRDAFIFQCFTGFAYQDIYALTPENIIEVGVNRERWLIKERGKTKVTEMVPILPIIEELINKYNGHQYCVKNNLLIPVNSNTRYNGYLKEIATLCGINRELHTHLARHTFADMMLNLGVPLEDVSKMLGHKSIRTTERYCRVRKSRISESMNRVRSKLFNDQGHLISSYPSHVLAV